MRLTLGIYLSWKYLYLIVWSISIVMWHTQYHSDLSLTMSVYRNSCNRNVHCNGAFDSPMHAFHKSCFACHRSSLWIGSTYMAELSIFVVILYTNAWAISVHSVSIMHSAKWIAFTRVKSNGTDNMMRHSCFESKREPITVAVCIVTAESTSWRVGAYIKWCFSKCEAPAVTRISGGSG